MISSVLLFHRGLRLTAWNPQFVVLAGQVAPQPGKMSASSVCGDTDCRLYEAAWSFGAGMHTLMRKITECSAHVSVIGLQDEVGRVERKWQRK